MMMISSAILQIIAMVCMLFDHVGYYLLNDFWLFRIIGRLAMPLFVFGLAEGFIHTSSKAKYFFRLVLLAIVTEIPLFLLNYNFGRLDTYAHNILINFAFGFLALLCISKNKYLAIFIPILAGLGGLLRIEYSWTVVPLVVMFYLILKRQGRRNVSYYLGLLTALVMINCLLAAQIKWPLQLFSIAAIIPIALYSGAKGKRLPRFISYAFYPCQFLLILAIRLLFFH